MHILFLFALFNFKAASAGALCTKKDIEQVVNDACSAYQPSSIRGFQGKRIQTEFETKSGLFFKCNGGLAWYIYIGPEVESYIPELKELGQELKKYPNRGIWKNDLQKSISNDANNPVFARSCNSTPGSQWITLATSKYKL